MLTTLNGRQHKRLSNCGGHPGFQEDREELFFQAFRKSI